MVTPNAAPDAHHPSTPIPTSKTPLIQIKIKRLCFAVVALSTTKTLLSLAGWNLFLIHNDSTISTSPEPYLP